MSSVGTTGPRRAYGSRGAASFWRRDPEVEPGRVGMDAGRLDALAEAFREAAEAGELFRGAQMAVYRDGRRVLEVGGGTARVRTGEPVTPETLFVTYSATKGLSALVMAMLHERGALHYDEPVAKYWPEFAASDPAKAAVTIRHVLSHRAGFPTGPDWLGAELWPDRAAVRRAMEEVPLAWRPGEHNGYHALNFGWVVNELVERVDGRDCGRFAREEVLEPLGIAGELFLGLPPDEGLEARVAWCYNRLGGGASGAERTGVSGGAAGDDATHGAGDDAASRSDGGREDLARRELEAQELVFEPDPADPDAVPEHRHPFNRPEVWRAVMPAANGIATARALAHLYAPLARGGELDGLRLVWPETLAHATTPTNRRDEVDRTIGWPIRWGTGWHMDWHGAGSTLRTFGHGGAGGQVAFADPDRRLAFAFLTNAPRSPRYLGWRYRLQGMAFQACRD